MNCLSHSFENYDYPLHLENGADGASAAAAAATRLLTLLPMQYMIMPAMHAIG